MQKIQLGARIVLGLIYFVFGLMGLAMAFGFMKPPVPEMPQAAMTFSNAIMGTAYFLMVLKLTEAIGGFCVLFGVASPAALVVLAPVTLHIFLFHFFLTPGFNNLILPLVMLLAHVIAMSGYAKLYRPLFFKK